MSGFDTLLQIGAGATGGAIAGVVASFVLTAIKAHWRRRERLKQIKVVRDHILKEFVLLARTDDKTDAFRHVLAPDTWDRLQKTVDHLTDSLSTYERGALHSALRFLWHNQRHVAAGTKALSVERLRELYHVVANTVGPAFDLPANPQWGSPQQDLTPNKTV